MRRLLLSMLCLIIIIDSDVATGNTLPDWGKVCVASGVRSGPDLFYPVVGSVATGQRVRIHDQSRPSGEWVSIGTVQWIPIKSLCKDWSKQ